LETSRLGENQVKGKNPSKHPVVGRRAVLAAIDAEPELPGDPPPELLTSFEPALTRGRVDALAFLVQLAIVLRATVRATKANIKKRVLDL
jgi:hypothetical protein